MLIHVLYQTSNGARLATILNPVIKSVSFLCRSLFGGSSRVRTVWTNLVMNRKLGSVISRNRPAASIPVSTPWAGKESMSVKRDVMSLNEFKTTVTVARCLPLLLTKHSIVVIAEFELYYIYTYKCSFYFRTVFNTCK